MHSIRQLPRSSLLTRTAAPSATTTRVILSTPRRRSFAHTPATLSTSGYGDADQTGESSYPERAGPRPRIDTEHPGRQPVDEGKGSGSGGTAETGSSSKHGNKTSGKGYGEATSDGPGDLQGGRRSSAPSPARPGESWDDDRAVGGESADVQRHNREMDSRYDHKRAGPDEKVGKGFWNGE
ncbi:hypothetical protein DFP73DRAFT_568890 [Morchella snyderi]|nr:hypothetical protein DFP73DRAFT_568890 [Morchella snyderi]